MSRIWRELREAQRAKTGGAVADVPDSAQSDARLDRRAEDRHENRGDNHKEQGTAVADRRNTKRRAHQFPLLIYGSDAEKQPFHEETETLDINEDGCSLSIENSVVRGQRLFLANKVNQAEIAARVVHVGRRAHGKVRIGVEFLRSAPEFWLAD